MYEQLFPNFSIYSKCSESQSSKENLFALKHDIDDDYTGIVALQLIKVLCPGL